MSGPFKKTAQQLVTSGAELMDGLLQNFLVKLRIYVSINYVKTSNPEASKQTQTIALPPPCLSVGMMFFF